MGNRYLMEKEFLVKKSMSAKDVGSGDLNVLSSPSLMAFIENVCKDSIKELLKDNMTSVGTKIELNHLKSSPIGIKVRVCSEVVEIDRRLIKFSFKAYDEVELIADGSHERFIVNMDKFQEKADKKKVNNEK